METEAGSGNESAGGTNNSVDDLSRNRIDPEDEIYKLYKECFLQEPNYIVDLEDDEEKKVKICINDQCESKGEFVVPPKLARSYYSASESKNLKICKPCLERACSFYGELVDKFKSGKSVCENELPMKTEVISVDSDDEDDKGGKEELGKNNVSAEMLKLLDLTDGELQQLSLKYDLPGQMNEGEHLLETQVDNLCGQYKSIEKEVIRAEQEIALAMDDLYKAFDIPRQEVAPYEVPYEPTVPVEPVRPPVSFKAPVRPAVLPDHDDVEFSGTMPAPVCPPSVPEFGTYEKPELKVGDKIFVMKISTFSEWVPTVIEEVIRKNVERSNVPLFSYKVVIDSPKSPRYRKDVPAELIAYYEPPPVRLAVGTRIISKFTSKNKFSVKFFSGMIAESPICLNNFRYLIFFDDGHTQYVNHDDLRLVAKSKHNVWEHFNPKVQQFIKRYLHAYPERAMLKVKHLDSVKTEHKGLWVNARVIGVDCSLLQLLFLHDTHQEWLYRGSTRLLPMYYGLNHKKAGPGRPRAIGRGSGPFVHYDVVLSDEEDENLRGGRTGARAVARKSSTRLPDYLDGERIYGGSYEVPQQSDGTIERKVPSKLVRSKPLRPHRCDPSCTNWVPINESDMKNVNLLVIPVMYGFSRELDEKDESIYYTAPCGRRLKSMEELSFYLRETELKLSADMFTYEPWVDIFNEYNVSKEHVIIEDLSYGREMLPIPCVNTINSAIPGYMEYMTERRGYDDDVFLNLDPEFLVGCDCTDNCSDKSKCSCWQLTYAEGALLNRKRSAERIGYEYKRLPNMVSTGIYECNSRCKCCRTTCFNRVVQHPLKLRLQLFMTKNKGWGTRCLNDIPAGTFICVYVGNIFSEAVANEDGKRFGDEYFAELDYIEVVEANKEGYEEFADPEPPRVTTTNQRSNMSAYSRKGDDEFRPSIWTNGEPDRIERVRLRNRIKQTNKGEDDSEDELDDLDDDEIVSDSDDSGNINMDIEDNEEADNLLERNSVRNYFGPNESVYIMDAKNAGNIGRYLNHSCDPNIFVQNVFVDTHDLRFPWVAFFALRYIRAGTELTWDYRYEVGSVPGKRLRCFCGSEKCRGRLL